MEESALTQRARTCYDRGTRTISDRLLNGSSTVCTGCLHDRPFFQGIFVAS
jgi:hypothetical protein